MRLATRDSPRKSFEVFVIYNMRGNERRCEHSMRS